MKGKIMFWLTAVTMCRQYDLHDMCLEIISVVIYTTQTKIYSTLLLPSQGYLESRRMGTLQNGRCGMNKDVPLGMHF